MTGTRTLVVGLITTLSLVACSTLARLGVPDQTTVGCSLDQFHANLVVVDGQPVAETLGSNWRGTVRLDWPDGWSSRAADGGQLEVVDGSGAVQVRTGTHVIFLTADYMNPTNLEARSGCVGSIPWT